MSVIEDGCLMPHCTCMKRQQLPWAVFYFIILTACGSFVSGKCDTFKLKKTKGIDMVTTGSLLTTPHENNTTVPYTPLLSRNDPTIKLLMHLDFAGDVWALLHTKYSGSLGLCSCWTSFVWLYSHESTVYNVKSFRGVALGFWGKKSRASQPLRPQVPREEMLRFHLLVKLAAPWQNTVLVLCCR